ncbi:THUMP domain-containing class I SAM-dependent RNA methyltransferase [Atopobacter phocae]|uniref:THUMP domain-containing class I SAM-dependent RNA methyltransferase n=1 Tax=Atopobacter phocae TaxID=136492 RepID=UPI000471C095|nr:class I SAM-dependent RNA methyltransferase [Atopobacter phocae]
MTKKFQLLATMASGLETLTRNELTDLGYEVTTDNGKVFFEGNYSDIARTNLWLRTADRIKIVFGQFKALSFEELFDQTYDLPWENILPMDAEFPVSGKSIKSKLYSVPNVQAIVKKAIVKRLQDTYKRRGQLPETGALYPIEVAIRNDQVQLTIDTTGDSLFKRGYRISKGAAPLKENMAAALILLTNWSKEKPFVDPMCGSGTLAIEAALIGMNVAPGLNREFVSEHWTFSDENTWNDERQRAEEQIDYDIELNIAASDIDPHMIEIAKQNAMEAGCYDQIRFKQMNVADFRTSDEDGVLVTNPPYGDRLLTEEEAHQLYKVMGIAFAPLDSWSKYILTSDLTFESFYGQRATKKRKLYNGRIRTDYFQYWARPKRFK